ncbi:MAG: amidohydrolase family protein [Lachnospiraceae bacterium]|nr:amidohydrolase family protein [Lachnospiraceae bacterium]
MQTILITGGIVYDGLGNPGKPADLYLEGGKISRIGETGSLNEEDADLVIDAAGKAVTPGFVDIHRHHDARLLNDPGFGITELRQGITTAVSGNCGISMVPRPSDSRKAEEYYAFEEPVMGPVDCNGPVTYDDYLEAAGRVSLPLNTAAMIGTGAVKICVKGFSDTPYTQQELEEARVMIENALKAGAPGISLGIMYLPECYSSTDEFAYILEPVGRYGRVITTHIRGEGDSMVSSVAEVIEIARKARCALEISHFKSVGMKNWRKDIYSAIDLIEKARAEGMDVTCDFYPYEGGSTALTTMLPPVFVAGDMKKALEKLGTPEGVEEFRRTSRVLYENWDNFCVTLGWERIIISGINRKENEKYLGMTVTEAADQYGFDDAEAFAAYLMHSENGKTAIINMSMCQDDIDVVAKLPYSNIISDSIYAETDTPHPRMFGAFPKVIREYVRERGLLTMEEAIRKMTSQPAARMKLQGKGILREGMDADVLIFDPDLFTDHATFADPAQYAGGLDWSIIGGTVVVDHDEVVNRSAGKLLLAAE